MFYVTCKKRVTHLDRDIEAITFRDELIVYLMKKYKGEFGDLSCEMIAAELVEQFGLISCEVLEDEQQGGMCEAIEEN